MKIEPMGITGGGLLCGGCGAPLKLMPVEVTYMGSSFPVELQGCSACGAVLIPPELAMGKMLEVEKILEDK